MRYVAKIHVLDVMDTVVVSGYVVDCDEMTDSDHQPWEFACTLDGLGEGDPMRWLQQALSRADLAWTTPLTNHV